MVAANQKRTSPGETTMKSHIAAIAFSLTALAAGAAFAQPPAAAPAGAPAAPRPARPAPPPATGELTAIPANLKPRFISAAAITVADLDVEQAWYGTVFGFVKIRDVSANERVLSLNPSDPNATTVVIQKSARQPGATSYGRLILNVANAKNTADFLQTHGVQTRAVLPNQAYFLADPEGNQIEIYQPDYVAPAAPAAAR